MTKPPRSAGATLSGCPSISMASSSSAASSSADGPPSTSARASTSPPTMAAEDEPRPRACGIELRQVSRSPVGCPPRASNARRIARTTRWSSSSGTTPAPAPVTSTTRPGAGQLALELVAQVEGQAERVETGTQVGRGRRDLTRPRPRDHHAQPGGLGGRGHVGVDDRLDQRAEPLERSRGVLEAVAGDGDDDGAAGVRVALRRGRRAARRCRPPRPARRRRRPGRPARAGRPGSGRR